MARAKGPTVTEWLDELVRLSAKSDDDGMTAFEWAEAMGVEHECALRRLKKAKDMGWLKVGRRRTFTINDRACISPVYQIVRPKSGGREV